MDGRRSKEVARVSFSGKVSTIPHGGGGGFRSHKIADVSSSIPEIGGDRSGIRSHRNERLPRPSTRRTLFSKHTSSKWADAQKWIRGPAPTPHVSRMEGGKGMNWYLNGMTVQDVVEEDLEEEDDMDAYYRANDAPNPSFTQSNTYMSPLPTVPPVPMRDMGTEMTPVASQEPSRATTPNRHATPMRSPSWSRRSSMDAIPPSPAIATREQANPNARCIPERASPRVNSWSTEMMAIAARLAKPKVIGGSTRGHEIVSKEDARSDRRSAFAVRAAAWEEAEKGKSIARFAREEVKIEAWKNNQRAKIEAEMRKIEIKVERMRVRANDRLLQRIALTRQKTERKRAVAEERCDRRVKEVAKKADHMRRTGRLPRLFSCWNWCL